MTRKTTTIRAIYAGGLLRPRRKLPLPEHAQVTLIIQPADPVSRTKGAFRVPKRLARVLIYDAALLDG